MGVVFRARQISLNRVVALKMILAGQLASEAELKRFHAEAEAAASLDHPNIVPIYEVGEQEGQHYFSMRLIEGRSLADLMAQFQDDATRAARLMVLVARAVHFAHQRGILHRDLKPANILIDAEGQPHVTDFGLAKRVGRDSHLTLSGTVLGTPSYMAPEQALGKTRHLTTAADIHSLGAILYQLLTGWAPFDMGTPFETIRRLVEQEPTRPRLLKRTIDRDLETICLKCLEKDPTRRYGSAEALAEDLERWLRREPILARRATTAWRLTKWVQRKPALAITLALLHLVAALGLVGILVQWHRAQDAQRDAIDKLRASYLAQAQAWRFSGQPGRRFTSLEALARAAAIRPSIELRNEAIACLPLVDLKPAQRWEFKLGRQRVFFSDALNRQAVGDQQGNVVVRDLPDDRQVFRVPALPGLPGPPEVRFSPDGRRLSVSFGRAMFQTWDLGTGQALLFASGDRPEFSPDSQSLVTADTRAGLSVYDVATGRLLRNLASHAQFQWPSFDATGQRLAAVLTPGKTNLLVLEASSGTELARLPHNRAIHSFAWHPAGRFLASCQNSHTAITIWDVERRAPARTLEDPHAAPVSLAFSPDGTLLAAGGWDGRVRVWDFAAGRLLLSASGGGFVQFSRDGQALTVTSWARDAAWRFQVAAGSELRSLWEDRPASEGGERITFNRDGRVLAYTIGQQLKLCDPRSGRLYAVLTNPPIQNVLADPVGDGFCLSGQETWLRWPLQWSEYPSRLRIGPLQRVGPGGDLRWSAVSADGRIILAQHGPDHFHVFEGETYRELVKMTDKHPGLRYQALSPDGRWAASGAWHNPTVKLWDARTGGLVRTIQTEEMSSVAFSPDQRWLVIGGKDYQFLECGTWVVKRRLARPPMERFPPAMAFSRDGQIMALCPTWRSIRLLRVEDGRELATLEPPVPWNISHLSLSADASLLAVAGGTPEFHVWDLRKVRRQLSSLGLDWEMPPYPEPDQPGRSAESPLEVEVENVLDLHATR
jgi:eukaryotic-like serine/threonine-protein kinase